MVFLYQPKNVFCFFVRGELKKTWYDPQQSFEVKKSSDWQIIFLKYLAVEN